MGRAYKNKILTQKASGKWGAWNKSSMPAMRGVMQSGVEA
jgi:hypothetical protein